MNSLDQIKKDLKQVFNWLGRGEVSYDEAKQLADPLIQKLNQEITESTKRLNERLGTSRRPARQSFVSLRRNQGLLL